MVIPAGKRFLFQAYSTNLDLNAQDLGIADPLLRNLVSNRGLTVGSEEHTYQIIQIPPKGYTGIAYSSQEIGLSLVGNYTKPFEGIFSSIPQVVDLPFRLKTGISLNNSKFSHLKYWTGTEPPEITARFTFETRVDSFFDVYAPVLFLASLALPGITKEGFYTSPSPTIRIIADEFGKAIKEMKNKGLSTLQNQFQVGTDNYNRAIALSGKIDTITGSIGKAVSSIEEGGFATSLLTGSGMRFSDILIKSVNINMSQELAYAPLLGLTSLFPAFPSPYSLPPTVVDNICRSVCSVLATGKNLVTAIDTTLSSLGLPPDSALLKSVPMPAFPIKCDVDVSFEMLYPVSRVGTDATSINNLFEMQDYGKASK